MKAEDVAQLLPWVFQRTNRAGNPLSVLLEVIEELQKPSEEILANVDRFIDPYRTHDRFVPYLASWVGLEHLLEAGEDESGPQFAPGNGQLRELIASSAFLFRWRGTRIGLLRFLETATGVQGFVVEENPTGPDNRAVPFHVRVEVPSAASEYESLITRIIESEKPAYVTYEVVMSGAVDHRDSTDIPEQ